MLRRHTPIAIVLGVGLLGSGCAPAITLSTVPPAQESRATISAQPSGPAPVSPASPVVVRSEGGRLSSVAVIGPKGPLQGRLSADGRVWTASSDALGYGADYRIAATAVDARGVVRSEVSDFSTVEPEKFFTGRVVSPAAGSVMGVGTPIVVEFDRKIKRKADVERALVVGTPTPVLGAWAWRDDTTVEFRPKEFWPGNMPVTVDLELEGVQGGREIFGQGNTRFAFELGPSMVTRVNAETFTAEVFRDGERIKTIPITTGKAGFETRSGIKVITTKERTRIMDAATGGTDPADPEYYRLKVEYAMRVTNSGEFVHAAPWSAGSQGRANVSHGCIGMSTSNAEWLFSQTNLGDVVEVVGTGVPQNLGNGITVWNEPWEEWLLKSSAGPVVTTVVPATASAESLTVEPAAFDGAGSRR